MARFAGKQDVIKMHVGLPPNETFPLRWLSAGMSGQHPPGPSSGMDVSGHGEVAGSRESQVVVTDPSKVVQDPQGISSSVVLNMTLG